MACREVMDINLPTAGIFIDLSVAVNYVDPKLLAAKFYIMVSQYWTVIRYIIACPIEGSIS